MSAFLGYDHRVRTAVDSHVRRMHHRPVQWNKITPVVQRLGMTVANRQLRVILAFIHAIVYVHLRYINMVSRLLP